MEIRFDGKDQDWYNICTALRGPDSDDHFASIIKRYTTARFRYITGISGDGYCILYYYWVTPWVASRYLVDSARDLAKKPFWWNHWWVHTFKGARSIGKLYPEYMMEMDMIANMLRYINHIFKRNKQFKGQISDVKITH